MPTDMLTWLLVASILVSAVLMMVAAGTLGRNLADIEYQQASGINGIRRIQAWRNVRTHANRIFLGASFALISLLLLADAPETWRMWTNRVLFVLMPLLYAASSFADWIDDRRQLRLSLRADPHDPPDSETA